MSALSSAKSSKRSSIVTTIGGTLMSEIPIYDLDSALKTARETITKVQF
jgi:hypothetical protein